MLLGDLNHVFPALDPSFADLAISGITADSRAVVPGAVFVALKGNAVDGAQFVPAAIAAGAVAIVAADDHALPDCGSVPVLRVGAPRLALARVAAALYARQPQTIAAITGTSGKTSIAAFLREIWLAAGVQAASLGTIGVVAPSGAVYGSLTTPDPVTLHQTLDQLAGDGVTHLAMEASSHGLDQSRLHGVRLKAAGFINLGRDHMDYHPTVEDYFRAKSLLFSEVLPADGTVVANMDDAYGRRVAAMAEKAGRALIRTGRQGVELRLVDVADALGGQQVHVQAFGEDYHFLLPLIGAFQVENALVAAGLAIGCGLDVASALDGLKGLRGAPGRLELIGETAAGAKAFVDYAHKPDALETVLKTAKAFTQGRLIVVFGAGGDRDKGKRALMGAAARDLADIVIVTDDNPRTEEPAAIRQAILAAVPAARDIGDRGAAIAEAVAMLEAGDVLIVAGKGHESGQIVGTEVLPFSDHDAVRAALAAKEGA